MIKFNKVNSWIKDISAERFQKIFEEALSTYPQGFKVAQFRELPSFKALGIVCYKPEYSAILTQRFKAMGLIRNENFTWFFIGQLVVLDTVEEIVGQMQSLESQLIGLGYEKTSSAVYEKTEVVSITI
jgi:hypothetical protein